MTACELIRVHDVMVNCFSDLGLCRIGCCMVLHHSEVIVSSLFVMSRTLYDVISIIILCSYACVICVFDCLFVICY